MISQTTAQSIENGAGKRARLLALALGAVLAAQVAMVAVTEREARAISTEEIVLSSPTTAPTTTSTPIETDGETV